MHADPDRRPGLRKTLDASEFSPPLADLLRASQKMQGAAIKVAPSTEFDEASLDLIADTQHVWLGSYDDCRQQLLLVGDTRQADKAQRGAVLCFPEQVVFWGDESEEVEYAEEPGKYVYQLHSALHASELNQAWANTVGLEALDDERGYYTSEEYVDSPWVQAFEFHELLPWDDRKVRRWLRSQKVRNCEVKCRNARVDANQYQRKYSNSDGCLDVSLLVTTFSGRVRALACTRVGAAPTG